MNETRRPLVFSDSNGQVWKICNHGKSKRRMRTYICEGCGKTQIVERIRGRMCPNYIPYEDTERTDWCPWRVRYHSKYKTYYAQTRTTEYGWIAVHTLKARLRGLNLPFITHHRDGDTLNNSDENLQFMTQADHVRLHRPRARWKS